MIIIEALLIAFIIVFVGIIVEDYIKEKRRTDNRPWRKDED
jgi:cbb3-type cytochrome oxidase subunit 3